jgi:hypothetical protein
MKTRHLIALNLLFSLLALELLGVVVYATRHSALYYVHTPGGQSQAAQQAAQPASRVQGSMDGVLLHPYVGYVIPGGLPNLATDPQRFVVALFGGSVANGLILNSRKTLIARLQSAGMAPGRNIDVVFLGANGQKQPQFLQTLAFYLSRGAQLDAVVVLDGFNELVHAVGNNHFGMSQYMPLWIAMLPLREMGNGGYLTSEVIEHYALVQRLREEAEFWRKIRARSPSAFIGVVAESMSTRWKSEYQAAAIKAQSFRSADTSKSNLYLEPATDQPYSTILKNAAANWVTSSVLMKRLLETEGIPYVHVLQPVKYYADWLNTGRRPPVGELISTETVANIIIDGYPMLLSELPRVAARGVRLVDATGLFDNIKETVYLDDCCHVNRRGADIMMNLIADELIAQLKTRSSRKQ